MNWIDRKKELPKEDAWYIVSFDNDGFRDVYIAFYDTKEKFFDSGAILPIDLSVTHWMPLPEPP